MILHSSVFMIGMIRAPLEQLVIDIIETFVGRYVYPCMSEKMTCKCHARQR